jgi:hypothetical protein
MSRNFSVRYVFVLIGYINCMRFRRFVEYVAPAGIFFRDAFACFHSLLVAVNRG